VIPPLQPGVGRPYQVQGIWFLSHLLLEGTGPYPNFWAIIGDLWYLGYRTPTVASKPSVKRVAGFVYSMGGRIGTHMALWVPPQDSVVRPWGESLHSHNSESHGCTHRVAPEAAVELKDHTEAKFHMYYFGLR
jgi:hypothetical protein